MVGADRPEFNAPAFGQRYFHCLQSWIDSGMYDLEIDKWQFGIDMSAKTTPEIRDAILLFPKLDGDRPGPQRFVFFAALRAPYAEIQILKK